ncbi:MAG: uracil-DNA glycosylase [Pseudomonadota bacterium]
MDQNATTVALTALSEWWEDMGVEVDQAAIKAAIEGASTPKSANSTASKDQKSATSPETGLFPTSQRSRSGPKSVEDWIAEAESLAAAATNLPSLKAAIESFEGCDLKKLCNKTVVYDGTIGAPVMVLGEGPGGNEDQIGLPFVGKAGQLLDKMLTAIGLDRKINTFISNVNYWRPPGNRNPDKDELAVCRPFVNRMVDLAQPKVIIAAGGVAAKSLLDTTTGIMRLRGSERPFITPAGTEVPMFPMFHPAYLLRRSQDKSRAWRDLLLVQERLREMGVDI